MTNQTSLPQQQPPQQSDRHAIGVASILRFQIGSRIKVIADNYVHIVGRLLDVRTDPSRSISLTVLSLGKEIELDWATVRIFLVLEV